ncbi:hypothetical protein [Prosthecobacter sp.]|jgi:hypothetical protein|uniref:hypothetical protein n=1 Tax=Prosthecobacter sp. TaxID=1965333 RepID=UPI00378302B4
MRLLLPTALTLSLMLNALLVWRGTLHQPIVAAETVAAEPPAPRVSARTKVEKAPPPSLNWKQVEAPDFPTYIANLRKVGCPEPTLRAIVQMELSQALRARQQDAGGPINEATLVAEEKQLLESLLGVQSAAPPEASTQVAAQPAGNPAPESSARPSITAYAPAAFLVGNAADDPVLTPEGLSTLPTDSTLPPETLQRLGDMRRQFGEQVSSSATSDQNEMDQERQWRKARRESDDIFISRYGGDYFMRVQQNARLQEVLNAQKASAP